MAISTVLVTGAAGGIGWMVCRLLREKGVQVIAFDNFVTGLERPQAEGVTWVNVDIADAGVPKILDQYPIDAVVHLAARLADQSLNAPTEDVRTNAFGSMQLFEWCAGKGVKRVVFSSSSGVYGNNPPNRPIKETDPVGGDTIYAVNKIACERYLEILNKKFKLPWTVLRFFPTYGTTHKPSKTQGILNVMLTQLLEGNTVVVKGSLDRVRDMVYVEDTARAVVDSLFSEKAAGKVMNVGSGNSHTVRDMIHFIAEALGRKPSDLDIQELPGTPGDPMYNTPDISLLKKTIGFKPKVSMREGIAQLVQARTGSKVPVNA